MKNYRTFKRTANNWEQFGSAKKTTDRKRLSRDEAKTRCKWWNENRTDRQIKSGTMLEFEQV